ncbi:TauD/TfdA dioxygenase family protein [Zavarzinia sp. CC-PAN008]|uniref:TauD/TfdA dioxygenase family protein n=1 Tax=Zavarzinia sp. CC-PAN008 TaxID=3243332 RepID=UPI003F742A8C
MGTATIEIRKVGARVGAEILGVDLSRPDGALARLIREALDEHGVVFFRDQRLTPDQHVALAERFGPININRFFRTVADYPMIAEVRKEPDQTMNIGGGWHTDHSYDLEPALGSILVARDLPPSGGDTLFASMVHAYETLPDEMKARIADLKAVHSTAHAFGAKSAYAKDTGMKNAHMATHDTVHPVVIRHPANGRPVLYVNPGFTVRFDGQTEEESRPLLHALFEHAMRPEHAIRFQWRPGSVAFWDNRATWHKAENDYHGERRVMHRITIEGVPLAA